MQSPELVRLFEAAKTNPLVLADLLCRPVETAASLGITISKTQAMTLEAAAAEIAANAHMHDVDQHRTGKQCVFYPILGTLPGSKRKKPAKPPRRKKPKPS